MEVEEPWEALDTDDTDLSSSTSLLRHCTHQPRLSNITSQPPQQQPSTIHRLIPGPAAAIQAAMHRHNNANQPSEISTQEYIRRVEEDSGEEFSRRPWVFALEFLHRHGMADTTPVSAIKKCVNAQRIDKVVAIVKSCAPNGLGDVMITLKDPTGTISASIHRKVLSLEEFGKMLAVGSVLILKKVVAFSSSCRSCYLNITRSNIAKVISVDCEVQNFPEANLDSTPVPSIKSVTPENTFAPVSGRTERVVGDVRRISNSKGKEIIQELTGQENYTQSSSSNNGRQIKSVAENNSKHTVHIDLVDSGYSAYGRYNKQQECNSVGTRQPGPGSLEGIFRNLQDLDTNAKHRKMREHSSAPGNIENLGDRNWQANAVQVERLLRANNCSMSATEKVETTVHAPAGTSSRMPKNADDLHICSADDFDKQQQLRGIGYAPGMAENLAKRDVFELNGGVKLTQQTETKDDGQDSRGANGVKKQRLALISRTAIQEWTDEQLCVLDMDED
ncbi:uncharacterized protein LOC104907345 [Beta vulgaris subsp. vulgaris]|uniref:uncharacterized protein LOC104907345 n=1 Tax=Beta vulgaris subsp. vulgaris TaxID=3555 RepID=UPI002036C82E|nr:uncharacterized protein LOC104907345 [Beta vulgaris subsp. vulgaris]